MRFWALSLLSLGLVSAAGAAPAGETQVRQRCAGLMNRINAHDLRGIRTYFSPKIRMRGTRGTVQNYFQVLSSMSRTFKQYPRYRTRLNVQKVLVKGDRAYLTAAFENTGMRRPDRGRCNMVWRRVSNRWLLASLSGA